MLHISVVWCGVHSMSAISWELSLSRTTHKPRRIGAARGFSQAQLSLNVRCVGGKPPPPQPLPPTPTRACVRVHPPPRSTLTKPRAAQFELNVHVVRTSFPRRPVGFVSCRSRRRVSVARCVRRALGTYTQTRTHTNKHARLAQRAT